MESDPSRHYSDLEERAAFWIKFAETWKALADLASDSARDQFLANSRVCLSRAAVVRNKIESLRTKERPKATPTAFSHGGPDEAA